MPTGTLNPPKIDYKTILNVHLDMLFPFNKVPSLLQSKNLQTLLHVWLQDGPARPEHVRAEGRGPDHRHQPGPALGVSTTQNWEYQPDLSSQYSNVASI